ncbi:F-box/kelch-repeat protein SKIP20 [Acorus calamus]|uniref:F-box/kelch-repeat protein SKIP20 n=1 Tax=Acorus calamus TaxID=4465 RepID=A0AAV9F3I9_ACOCL|nr:F-box/kelch-repeat protein SKIP20 [Acorus calamus]
MVMEENLIPGLPDDIGMECLVRVPHRYHCHLRSVCRRWRDLLSLPLFYSLRDRSGTAEDLLFLIQATTTTTTTTTIGTSETMEPPPTPSSTSEATDEEWKNQHQEQQVVQRLCCFSPPVYGLTVYNATDGTWLKMAPPPPKFFFPTFCQCVSLPPARLILFGGWDPETLEPIPDVYVYDFVAGRGGGWRRGAPMSEARSFFACAVAVTSSNSVHVYVAGGHDSQKNALRSAEVYDVDADEWRALPPMSKERDECHGLIDDDSGRFWVLSGYPTDSQGQFGESAEFYDPTMGEWSSYGGTGSGEGRMWEFPASSPRSSCIALRTMSSLSPPLTTPDMPPSIWYIDCGGRSLKEYDRAEGRWKVVGAIPDGLRSSPCCTYLSSGTAGVHHHPNNHQRNTRIFVIGGSDGEQQQQRHRGWLLDVGSGKWAPLEVSSEFSGFVYSASALRL